MATLFGKLKEAMGFTDPADRFDGDYTEFDGQDYRDLYEREQPISHGYSTSSDYGSSGSHPDYSTLRRHVSDPQEPIPSIDWASKSRSTRTTRDRSSGGSQSMSAGKVIGLPGVQQAGSEVIVVEPRAFDEMAEVIQSLRDRKTVVINLNLMDPLDAQRSVDFVAGGTYAIDGHQERIGENIFLFTPNCVSVTTPGSVSQPAEPIAPETKVPNAPVEEPSHAWPVAANG